MKLQVSASFYHSSSTCRLVASACPSCVETACPARSEVAHHLRHSSRPLLRAASDPGHGTKEYRINPVNHQGELYLDEPLAMHDGGRTRQGAGPVSVNGTARCSWSLLGGRLPHDDRSCVVGCRVVVSQRSVTVHALTLAAS